VTGANSGLGLAAVDALAAAGATVIMACRHQGRAEEARARLTGAGAVSTGSLDLADPDSIADFCSWFTGRHDQLDLLINNAGVMATPANLTSEGIELQWATNHLGHFALTGQLLDRLLATAGSRVVNVSSLAANSGQLSDHDPTTLTGYRPFQAYANSKLANLVFTVELDRRLRARSASTMAVAAHPGVTHTDLVRSMSPVMVARAGHLYTRLFGQRVGQGVAPTLRAAADPGAEGGRWFGPSGRRQHRGDPVEVALPAAAIDPGTGERLWQQSVELSGVSYLD
jgi:NAD(P)-dependent dehydrogenase (short-subunit alcohol dehydrogenase family)